ncbi:MAG: PaaI family thioesterase [Tetrasphaera sp.]
MSGFTARNPDFESVVRGSFAKQGLMTHFGSSMTRCEPGFVEIEVPYAAHLTQQQGFFHGGVTTSIVDTACGYAALTLMPAGSEVLTVEFKINLFAPAKGDTLIARGRIIRSGRTITVCHGDAYAVQSGAETHCATMTTTMIRVDLLA